MVESGNEITVRSLPDGSRRRGKQESFNGELLYLRLEEADIAGELRPRTLVEIETAGVLYLGEILNLDGARIAVGIEHLLDLGLLAALQDVWARPAER